MAIAEVAVRHGQRPPLTDPRHLLRRCFPTSRRLILERALQSRSLQGFDSVLVVGAGHDPYQALFGTPRRYVRLDIEEVPGITDVVADAMEMPFEDGEFECVVATECMEHVSDPFRFVGEITRVLAPGGQVLLTVPFLFHQHGDPYDFWRPTRSTLLNLFSEYREVEILALGHRLHVISDLVTTAYRGRPFFALRCLNHVLARLPGAIAPAGTATTAPTGFLLAATKATAAQPKESTG